MANPNAGTRMYYIRQSDGLAYCFSPVPLVAESQQVLRSTIDGEETRLGTTTTLTFNGVLLPEIPELTSISGASCFELLDRKSDQLKAALDEDYGNLLIVDGSGYPAWSIRPRITSISFDESQMVVRRDYSITFEYEEGFDSNANIREYDESWDFSHQEDDTIAVTHNVSAVGIVNYPSATDALQNAKTFVLARANSLDRSQYSFLNTPYMPGVVAAANLAEYNHVRSESINETASSYSISETWIMSSGSYKDDRTVERNFELDEFGDLIETVSINGTVLGYGDITVNRYNAAVDGFENYVANEIGFNLANNISSKNRSDNRFAGTVSYSIQYLTSEDAPIENRSIQRSLQRNDDGSVTQTVTTSASVKAASSSGIELAINFCFENNYPIDSTIEPFFDASNSGNVESVSFQRDDIAKSFSLSRAFRDQSTQLYREEYQVSREQNIENARTTVSINGTVQGLAAESGTKTNVRFNYASGAFFNTINGLAKSRALEIIPDNTCLGDDPISSTLGYNKFNGTITYSYRYDNRFLTSNPDIMDEKIDVSYNLQSDVIAVIPIPGKADGPILQDQETVTGLQKNLKIQYTMAPSGTTCGVTQAYNQSVMEAEALAESAILVNNTMLQNGRGEKPIATRVFKTADQYTFNRQTLVFTRNVTWQYTAS